MAPAPDDDAVILRAAIDAIPEGFVIYDADDRLVACNLAYRKLYERSAPVIVPGTPFEEILRYGLAHNQYPEAGNSDEEREAWLAERLAAHRVAGTRIVQQVGPAKWVQIEERRLPTGHVVGIRSDISEVRRLQARNQWLGDIIERSAREFFVIDIATNLFVYANHGVRDSWGYDAATVTTLHPWEVNAELDRDGFEAAIAPMMNGERTSMTLDTLTLRRDGTTYPSRITLYRDQDGDGRDVIAGVGEDMTEQRAMEETLHRQRRDLESLLRNIPDAISRARPDTSLTYVNAPYAALVGAEGQAMIGQRFIDFVDPPYRESLLSALTALTPEAPLHHSTETLTNAEGEMRTLR